jgi:minor extracellular serine protease Vpr
LAGLLLSVLEINAFHFREASMRITRLFAMAFAVAALVSTSQPLHATTATVAPKFETVIVRLAPSPLAQPAFVRPEASGHRKLDLFTTAARRYVGALGVYQTRIMRKILAAKMDATIGWRYEIAFDGFSVRLPANEIGRLRQIPGIVEVFPTQHYRPLVDINTSTDLVNAPAAWQALGSGATAGHGVLIADVDTGIAIHSPMFNDAGFTPPSFGRRADTKQNLKYTNNKVVIARAFGNGPYHNFSAADTFGHGTFTAAIEAGDYNILTPMGFHLSGVAPGAWLGNYNVFPDGEENTSDEQILAALDAASLDGADVINLSLGESSGDTTVDPWTYAMHALAQAGIPVVVSAGNDGPDAQSIGSPASAPDAIAVGSVTNSHSIVNPVSVTGPGSVPSNLQLIHSGQAAQAVTMHNDIGPAGYVYVGLARQPGDDRTAPNANDLVGKDLQGKIALIKRGNITFTTKVNNVAAKGAIAAVIFDNKKEPLQSIAAPGTKIPAMFVTQADGQALLAWLQQHPDAQLKIGARVQIFSQTPDVLSDFSSHGPTAPFTIKPDVVAPGEDIYSATERSNKEGEMYSRSGFTSASGTSFSAPHVTGVVALMLQAHPKWTPQQIKDALMNTANTGVYADSSQKTVVPIMEQGAGLVDAAAALNPPALVDPPTLSFGAINLADGSNHLSRRLTLSDLSGQGGTWSISTTITQGSGVTLSVPSSVSVTPNSSVQVPVKITLTSSAAQFLDEEGYIWFKQGTTTLHVPFWIHVLDYQPSIANSQAPGGVVLLVDASRPQATHKNVLPYYTQALTALHRRYAYWDEEQWGSPTLADLERAADVIYYTGANVGDIQSQSPIAPVSVTDQLLLHQYLKRGGHLFINGIGVGISSPYWTAVVLGGYPVSLSLFDNDFNDSNHYGGLAPSKPSAVSAGQLFSGLKAIDISNQGDGAHDNTGVTSNSLQLVLGVSGLHAARGNFAPVGHAYGRVVLRASPHCGIDCAGGGMGLTNADEPSLTHTPTYRGRSIYFSFGFEGINNNTGYATRAAVLGRILNWLDDRPSVHIAQTNSVIRAELTSNVGAHAVKFVWQIDSTTLHSSMNGSIRPSARTHKVRVAVTDSLGHVAVSNWVMVRH